MSLKPLALSLQFGHVADAKRHRAALPRHHVLRWIRHSLAEPAEITVRIVDEAEARSLNQRYRQKDYATNVLTFNYSLKPQVVADLVLCAPVVLQESKRLNTDLAAHYAHLVVHGSLHAQGWDHETSEADALAMEAHEAKILAGLGFKNPYAV